MISHNIQKVTLFSFIYGDNLKINYYNNYRSLVLFVCHVVDTMKSFGLLVLILMTARFIPSGTKHIAVTLDAKWKSAPLLLEAW